MPRTRDAASPLVTAAAALDDELRALDDLAQEAVRHGLGTDKGLTRTSRALTDSVGHQARIEERLRTLVTEIDAARQRQQQSMKALVDLAHELERRMKERDLLLARFAALGESAGHVNLMTVELAQRREAEANDQEVLERLNAIQQRMADVLTEAEGLATTADDGGWPEIARQAEAIRQQVQSAKNKLAIAQRTVAARAPS